MAEQSYKYAVVGGGLAGAMAIAGIRDLDQEGSLLLVGSERYLPYDRPPLTKKLWFGKKRVEDIFIHPDEFYDRNQVTRYLETQVTAIDAGNKTITDSRGHTFHCDKLLLATGGVPRRLGIPGGDLQGVCYYRYLDDYRRTREQAQPGARAVVIGGGFIGSEISAALNLNQVQVSMVFPEPYLVPRVFPEGLGRALQQHYQERGVRILAEDVPAAFEKRGETFITHTRSGQELESEMLIVGVGINPALELAQDAGLATGNGIMVNEYLQTSHPDIYAAGDNALFPYLALGQQTRVEHWDNALNQGKYAGRNMAGAHERYDYLPYFFSDLFEFGYEAVGDVNAKLETVAQWQVENEKGVIYYLQDHRVRGAMMCDVWEQVEAARELIRSGVEVTPEELKSTIG